MEHEDREYDIDPADEDRISYATLLGDATNGSPLAAEMLKPIVYAQLRRLARSFLYRERADHTLQPTDLVHEAYLRLFDQTRSSPANQAHFVALAATMMRRILINHAVAKNRQKRGSGVIHVTLGAVDAEAGKNDEVDLLSLDEALTALGEIDERQCQIVELRFFGGMSIAETAAAMKISPATVKREWVTAKLWLQAKMEQ